MHRWSIFIDIEGFSKTYNDNSQAMVSLRTLMQSIYDLGNKYFHKPPNRIFAHQIGDGFVIVGEFGTECIDVPLSVAILLMRQVLLAGGVAKSSISEGNFTDIKGCIPCEIREQIDKQGRIRLGKGVMTISPVMGTALINSYKLLSSSPSGALLITEKRKIDILSKGVPYIDIFNSDLLAIDWIHSRFELLGIISREADVDLSEASIMKNRIREYIERNELSHQWKRNTFESLNMV